MAFGFDDILLALMAASSANSLLSGGTDVTNRTPAVPAGGGNVTGVDRTFDQMIEQMAGQLGLPNLQGPTQAAADAASKTKAASQEAVGTPATTMPSVFNTEEQNKQIQVNADAQAPPSVGQILAAVPGALAAAGNILGVNDVSTVTQRPAPIAGGQPGQPVGQFARPFGGVDIGQLLAALPGIR